MPQELLHSPDIIALLKEMRRKAVPKGVAADAFVETYQRTCLAHRPL